MLCIRQSCAASPSLVLVYQPSILDLAKMEIFKTNYFGDSNNRQLLEILEDGSVLRDFMRVKPNAVKPMYSCCC